jgi:cyclopropane fatty-acyl-phospholipid synthase-like methyltransferase
MKDWTKTFAEDLWLKPDDVGAEEAAFIAKVLHLHAGQAVLDAPCGAGRIAVHLARRGCAVTGIDLRSSFTNRAVTRFQRERQHGRFMPMDFREAFHAAYS